MNLPWETHCPSCNAGVCYSDDEYYYDGLFAKPGESYYACGHFSDERSQEYLCNLYSYKDIAWNEEVFDVILARSLSLLSRNLILSNSYLMHRFALTPSETLGLIYKLLEYKLVLLANIETTWGIRLSLDGRSFLNQIKPQDEPIHPWPQNNYVGRVRRRQQPPTKVGTGPERHK